MCQATDDLRSIINITTTNTSLLLKMTQELFSVVYMYKLI